MSRAFPVMMIVGSWACKPDPAPVPAAPLAFLRGAVIAPAGPEGQTLPDGRQLVPTDWRPGETVSVHGAQGIAPRRAECVSLYQQPLGDVSRLVAMGGASPNTALAWSPDGQRLAVGSYLGELLVLDGWTGAVVGKRKLAETMVKSVVWSADGATLYVAEQSPDAFVRALDAVSLADQWTLRLADFVGSSPAPDAEDIYGIYTLPAAYGLQLLPGGDLLLAALHSWPDAEGAAQNRSQILRISAEGQVQARWPEAAADATFKYPRVDPAGGQVVFSVARSAAGPAPAGLPINGVQVLALPDLVPVLAHVPDPLPPHFQTAYIWEALDIGPQGVLMGFNDGRVQLVDPTGQPVITHSAGVPVMAGEVPLHASVGFGGLWGEGMVFSTTRTLIPWGAASPDLRPPTTHPGANTLWNLGPDGAVRWTWNGSHEVNGLSLSDDGGWVVVGAGDRHTDERRDLYGGLIFDLSNPSDGRSGEDRLAAVCATAGPVFFRQALSADGRLALAEHPYMDPDGSVQGAYRVTVLR